jgi:hypothetical protein
MCILGIVGLCVALGGCFETPFLGPSKDELTARQQAVAAKDDEVCRGYGAKPGTDIYVQCRMAQAQHRDAGDNGSGVTVVNSGAPGGLAAVPRSDAPRLPNCYPVSMAGGVRTVCN